MRAILLWVIEISQCFYLNFGSGFLVPPSLFKDFLVDFARARNLKKICFVIDQEWSLSSIDWRTFTENTYYLMSKNEIFYSQIIHVLNYPNDSFTKNPKTFDTSLLVGTFFEDSQIVTFAKIFKNDANQKLFWLLFSDKMSETSIRMLKLKANNFASFAKVYEDGNIIEVYDYYQATEDGKLYKTFMAKWKHISIDKLVNQDFTTKIRNFNLWKGRNNLSEVFFNCVVIPDMAYVTIEENKNGIVVKGLYGNIWQFLRQYLHFRYRIVKPKNDIYGNYDFKTQSWTGIIQGLIEKSYNMSISHLSITLSRSEVIDYLTPLKINSLQMFYSYPKNDEQSTIDSSFTHYVNEFSPLIWLQVGVIFISFVIFFKIMSHFHPREDVCSSSEALLLIFSLLCNIGYERRFVTTSGRIFLLTASMSFFLLLSYYSSFLISSLAVINRKVPFENLEGLYERKGEYKISTLRESAVVEMLQNSSIDIMRKIWKEMRYSEKEKFPTTVHELYSLISKEKVVGFLGTKAISIATEADFLTYPLHQKVISAWVVQKDFPFKQIFNYNLLKLIESGIRKREEILLHETMRRKQISKRNLFDDSWQPINIKNIFLPLCLLIVGMGLSILILFIERNGKLLL